MNLRKPTSLVALLLLHPLAFADASFQSTTQITGGSLVETLQKVSFLSHSIKDMLAPITTTTLIHGNQKAIVSKDSIEITDLDKEYIVHVDKLKKTYSVITFAEMRQAFLNMSKQLDKSTSQIKQAQAEQPQKPSDVQASFDVKVNNTGASKVVNGFQAQEQIITLTMKVTATNQPAPHPGQPAGPNSADYVITTDAWITPDPPEVKEIADFDIRFGKKLMEGLDLREMPQEFKQFQAAGNAATAQILGNQPGAAGALAQMAKEIAKLKGTRVLETTSMGGLVPAGTVPPAGSSTPSPSGQSVAGQIATDTATQTASNEASTVSGQTGILANALSNSMLGAFHRKKATPPPPPPPTPTATPGMQTVVLMATTTQKTDFSESPVPASAFDIPAGFRKIPSPMVSTPQ